MGTELNVTSPQSTDIVANYPADEQAERGDVKTLIEKEHYEGTAGNDRHKLPVFDDDTARDAAYAADTPAGPQSGNFNFSRGSAVATADEPRVTGMSFHDGTSWSRGTFLFTGAVIQCAFDPTTIEAVSDGRLLPAFGGAFADTGAYADLYAVIGNNFDTQNNVAAPGAGQFRVPNIAGSMVMGLSPDFDTPAGYMRNVSGQDDFRASGGYTGPLTTIYIVRISVAAGTDEFEFSSDSGATFSASTAITGGAQLMDNNVFANFAATTGHSVGDTWIFLVDPGMDTVGFTMGMSAWQLNEAEIPELVHSDPGDHTHNIEVYDGGGSNNLIEKGALPKQGDQSTDPGGAHIHDPHGGDQAHPTTPKVLVLGSVIVT